MQYSIHLKNKKERPYHFHDAIFDGMIPKEVVEMITYENVDNVLDLCKGPIFSDGSRKHCELACHCHVLRARPDIGEFTYDHLCPILFVDIFKPKWKLEDIL